MSGRDMGGRGRGRGGKVKKVMVQPINLIFRFLQSEARVSVWLYEQKNTRLEGKILGFDEFMNIVLDDVDEVDMKRNQRSKIGRIMLKGDNITLIQNLSQQDKGE